MARPVKLAVGFLVYGSATAKYLPAFVKSLLLAVEKSGSSARFWCWDNQPADQSNHSFLMDYPQINYLSGVENIGFGRAYNILITEALEKGKKVEIYMITSQSVKASVKGLFSEEKKNTNVFKEMENKCKEDYKKIEGDFPEWNYQERAVPWPKKIHESYVKFLTKRVKNR